MLRKASTRRIISSIEGLEGAEKSWNVPLKSLLPFSDASRAFSSFFSSSSGSCIRSATQLLTSYPSKSTMSVVFRESNNISSTRSFASQAAPKATSSSEQAESSTSTTADADLVLSDSAVRRMEELRSQAKDPVEAEQLALRLLVDPGGCSGFQYRFELTTEDKAEEEDRVLKKGALTLICDKVSLELLKGATIDYQEDLMRAAFVVHDNPQAGSSCGCGSSFSVKS